VSFVAVFLPLVTLLLPDLASACAVCFSGTAQTRGAFVATTILLTVLPLALVGGFLWWLRARVQEVDQAHRQVLQAQRSAQDVAIRTSG